MNDLKIFNNSEFGNLTVEVGSNNTVLFFLNEVCMHLGYTKTAKCKLCLNGMPVPLLRNCYSIFNGTKYR